MLERPLPQRNAFQETLLGMDYSPRPGRATDLFSRACVEQFRECDPTRFGYALAQVFEPNTLMEVAMLEGLPYESVDSLAHSPTAATARLTELAANTAELSVARLINLATALISISRFRLAADVLEEASGRAGDPREIFETAMLDFIVSNRRDDGAGSPLAFMRMREAIASGAVPDDRALDACAQAVVWYLKRREIPEATFRWYLAHGQKLAEHRRGIDRSALSSWYRALAMSPAARGDAETTRKYMERARRAAEETIARRPCAYEMHLLKTYYESSIKEHMYITRDLDEAEKAGHALITLDPAWAPSYGELADAYLMFGQLGQAAAMYEKAVEFGPPYFGHHAMQAARVHERHGNGERALVHYQALSRLVPGDEPLLTAGHALAQRLSHSSREYFEGALDELTFRAGGKLAADHG